LLPKSATDPIQCAFDSNTVTITNFAAHTAGGTIVVKNIHVLNPPELIDTSFFFIETYNGQSKLRDANYKIPGLSIKRRANVSKITHNEFYSNPSNGGYIADLTIKFIPSETIPVDSEIRINLPEGEFNNLSGNLQCDLEGGLSTFKSCVGDGSIVTLITNSAYTQVGSEITATLFDIMNFSPGLTSGLISIEISYSNTIFQESSDKEANRRYASTLGPSSLSVADFSFSPLTAGELATYTFGINLTN